MPKFSIAFIAPSQTSQLKHRIIESADQDTAMRTFFAEELVDCYSADDQGYFYFKDDFFDKVTPFGSIIKLD